MPRPLKAGGHDLEDDQSKSHDAVAPRPFRVRRGVFSTKASAVANSRIIQASRVNGDMDGCAAATHGTGEQWDSAGMEGAGLNAMQTSSFGVMEERSEKPGPPVDVFDDEVRVIRRRESEAGSSAVTGGLPAYADLYKDDRLREQVRELEEMKAQLLAREEMVARGLRSLEQRTEPESLAAAQHRQKDTEDNSAFFDLECDSEKTGRHWLRVVVQPHIMVRAKPRLGSASLATIPHREIIEVSGGVNGWAQLTTVEAAARGVPDDCQHSSWVLIDGKSLNLGVLLQPCYPRRWQVAHNLVMLRTKPDPKAPAIATAEQGQILRVSGSKGLWVRLTAEECEAREVGDANAWALTDASSIGLGILLEPLNADLQPLRRALPPVLPRDVEAVPIAAIEQKAIAAEVDLADCCEPLCLVTDGASWEPLSRKSISAWSVNAPCFRFKQVYPAEECDGTMRHELVICLDDPPSTSPRVQDQGREVATGNFVSCTFQVLSVKKTWNWRLYPRSEQLAGKAGAWGKHNVLVPDDPEAVEFEQGAGRGHRRTVSIVEPRGSFVKIVVELTEIAAGDACMDLHLQPRVWYELCTCEDGVSSSIPRVIDERLLTQLQVDIALRLRSARKGSPVHTDPTDIELDLRTLSRQALS